MNALIHVFKSDVADADGHTYVARAVGRARKNGTWVGWIEFTPRGTGGMIRRSPIETLQPNRAALEYWASGLEPVYLEGALERAITSRSNSRASSR
ncbi:MAG: hypothetical protein E6H91_03260 [Chloroflexi bacterium]|nr:MAG: hypothetical protein E6H91_03260 [Chloroflexota bacterium]